MADAPGHHRSDHVGAETDRDAPPGMPRWVKVTGVVAIVLVLLVGVLLLFGNGPGGHGPGRHTGSGDAGGGAPASSVTPAGGHVPPAGVPNHGQ